MGTTTGKGVQTRAAILEAAFELFSRQGYHATTIRQIAGQVGLTPGSIYNHFSGKDDIFLAVIDVYHPFNHISPLLAGAEGHTTEQTIRQLAGEIAHVLEDRPGLLNLSLVEMVELDGQHLPALVERFRPQVMAFVQRLLADPHRLRVSPLKASRVFFGLLFAFEVTDRLVQMALDVETADPGGLDDFIDIYLSGILTPKQSDMPRDEYA